MHPAQWWQIGRLGIANTFIAALIFINEKLALQINPFGSTNRLWCSNLWQKVSLGFIALAAARYLMNASQDYRHIRVMPILAISLWRWRFILLMQ